MPWNARVPTGELNRWLEAFTRVYSPPSHAGQLLKIKFISQIKARPPTFYVYVNNRSLFTEHFYKQFTLSLRKEFNFAGVPVRLLLRDKGLKAIKQHRPGFRVNKALLRSTVDELRAKH